MQVMSKARKILLVFTNLHHQIFGESFRVGSVDDLLENDGIVFHCAHELTAHGHQTRCDRTLEIFRGAHVDHAGRNRARRKTMLHECDEHSIHDAHIDGSWLSTQDLHEHDF